MKLDTERDSRDLFLCLQFETSSVLEFRVALQSAVMMRNFSRKHWLLHVDIVEYALVHLTILHIRVYEMLSFRNFQTFLFSSVLLDFDLRLKLASWGAYLVLKDVRQSPM